MPSRKPTLALTTPTSASFPVDARDALKSAASVRSPLSAYPVSSTGFHSSGLPSAGLPSAGLLSAGLSSAGLHSPAVAIKTEEGLLKTPIEPPSAYTDFLRMHTPASPNAPHSELSSSQAPHTAHTSHGHAHSHSSSRPRLMHRASISGAGPVKVVRSTTTTHQTQTQTKITPPVSSDEESVEPADDLDSGPSTASSASSCDCSRRTNEKETPARAKGDKRSPKIARIDTSMPASPFGSSAAFPMSAPAVGRTTFPTLRIPAPASPAVAHGHLSNLPTLNSPLRSPFSARSTLASPFDWESALKARFSQPAAHTTPAPHCTKCCKPSLPATPATAPLASTAPAVPKAPQTPSTIRHIREVVTRTVTYTPRMQAAPKGKKRKIECDDN